MKLTSHIRRIGISTGGGDCPGLNAVIRAVVKSAILEHRWQVLGIEDSFDGLIWPEKTRELCWDDVSGILTRGGTILGTTNRQNPLAYHKENGINPSRDVSDEIVRNARELGLDGVIVAGGDGTIKIALDLYRNGLPVIVVPKTIDNDVFGTDISVGFDTALHTVVDAIDKIHSSAESHHRVMLIEVMGRDVGWLALEAGIAAGADIILIPEIPFNLKALCAEIQKRESAGRRFTIIVVAEGIRIPGNSNADSKNVAKQVADSIIRVTSRDTRVTVLGHIQRGGSPSPFDRIFCTRLGVAATDMVARGEFGKMIALRGSVLTPIDLAEAARCIKRVDPNAELVRVARAVGTSFGDEPVDRRWAAGRVIHSSPIPV
jgi:ATP-dependent phosphofructokinase / diphosphate-dependent phosphofructokinase